MRTLIKLVIIVAITVVALPIYAIAHSEHIWWISAPVALAWLAAVTAAWKWQPKTDDSKFDLVKKQ
ncbi:hypothetical protein [Sutterella sp.]|uniref:hypothetical protein n=1 Tax=Sutterella sp. TaxID=1981025 RepID=UPI0026E0B601|nr:hypothetical protein [Sutterella sp.]MDO5532320.1 hypothetical protein [Sutterella sp.]